MRTIFGNWILELEEINVKSIWNDLFTFTTVRYMLTMEYNNSQRQNNTNSGMKIYKNLWSVEGNPKHLRTTNMFVTLKSRTNHLHV